MITTPVTQLPSSADVVVIGSGAAGLTAAIRAADGGLRVVVLEKAKQLGGTTAVGGGVAWLPASPLSKDAGYEDSPKQAADYIRAATAGALTEPEIDWYVHQAPRAAMYLHTETRATLVPLARPDYRTEWPGATEGGRSLDNAAFDVGAVPGLRDAIRPSSYFPLLTMAERDDLNGQAPNPALLAERAESGVRTMGGALVASLIVSALDRGVTIASSARVTSLERGSDASDDGGWIVGVDDHIITAANIVIASGGFEWSPELQAAFLTQPITPISAPSNEGDGLKLGLAAGAAVSDMTTFWGVPVITPAGHEIDGHQVGRMGNVEMTLPGSITVNSRGRRFVNEALNYHDVSRVFCGVDAHTLTPSGEPAWLIFDHAYFERYPVAGVTLGAAASGQVPWIASAPTLAELAEDIGVDPAGLTEQVADFNAGAERGEDPVFGRGHTPQDRFLGDALVTPNPCLRPLTKGPFYAVRLHVGTLGTSGGLATNLHGQVLGHSGDPIAGLYAAGNAAASVFRGAYPGGGATLGSAIVRAFSAGEHLAQERGAA